MAQKERKDYYFFRHFKMTLYEEQKLSMKTKLHDQTGKELNAITVFAAVLSYFKTEVVEHVQSIKLSKSNEAALTEKEFRWMITIPAIWSDSARQFMSEAAKNAGFDEEQVRLVLEPEAASLFCREQPMTVKRFGTVEPLEMGHKYILADLGGGTADICTHEVIEDGKLRELYRATGESAGGLKVNDEFIQFLIGLFGGEVVGKYKSNYARLYFELLQKFEVKKRMFKMTTETVALFLDSDFVKLIKTVTEENIENIIWNSKYRDNVEFLSENHKLIVSNTVMRGLFEGSVKEIISTLKEILSTCSSDNISTLVLTGGYSESPYLVARIKEEMKDIHIVQVIEPSLAVMKGAAMMGLKPKNIIERRSRFTYGFSTGNTFVDGVHPEHLKFFRDGKVYCKHIFKKLIEQNQVVKYQETFTTETSNTFRAPNSKQLVLRTSLWRSTLENPTYCTEEDKCEMVGIILHRPPSAGWPDEVVFKHQLIVGETEFTVKVFNKMTGEEYEAQMDFL